MNFSGAFQSLAISVLSILASVAAALATAAPAASFSASTANPAAGSLLLFTDTSGGAPTSWSWDFGDGTHAAEQNPGHVYSSPGSFSVRLTATNASGSASTTMDLTVTPETVLRLNGAHSFDLTLSARDPRTGNTGVGKVIGQNDVYGYFSLPTLSGNAGNPEIIVKMVDATGIGQNYWVFYGAMTDLEFTLAVKENATGVVKNYVQNPAVPSGQFDTTGFAAATVPTPPPGSGAH
jgi:PKD repeat protein